MVKNKDAGKVIKCPLSLLFQFSEHMEIKVKRPYSKSPHSQNSVTSYPLFFDPTCHLQLKHSSLKYHRNGQENQNHGGKYEFDNFRDIKVLRILNANDRYSSVQRIVLYS